MESVVAQAEAWGASREEIAPATVFISHETYTPARGGSAAAEVNALRQVFGAAADRVVVANTKGFTGHPMGVGIEDVVAVKALETGIVPPVPNFKEPDPDLGELNLSIGGVYPVRYALRLAAGFGSQISMLMLRWVPTPDGQRPNLDSLGYAGRIADASAWRAWLADISGDTDPHLEVDHRTLRVAARDAVASKPVPTTPAPATAPATVPADEPVTSRPAPTVAKEAAPADSAAAGAVLPAPPGRRKDLAARVVALVAEQTGYPPELLDLDLDLEADLGIDTVKQAELFAQVRETYGIARDDSLKLRDYPTLNHVIGFVRDRTPHATDVAAATPVAAAVAPPTLPDDQVLDDQELAARVVALVAEQTGYPPELLDLDLDLEADLGIDTVKQAELFAQVRETYGIARDDSLKLRDYPTLNHVIGFVRDRTPHTTVVAATAPVAAAVPPTLPDDGELAARVVALVAEQTGYPPELLDLDLDLEADLGIDTVKQAELFAQVRETYGIARDDSLKLRDYPTLNHVIGFVRDRTPHTTVAPATSDEVAEPVPADTPVDDPGFPRRVPVAVARPPLEWFAPTGVRLEAGSRVVVLPDTGGVAEALSARLADRGVEVLSVDVSSDSATVAGQLTDWLAAGPIEGLYALAALDNERPIAELDLDRWHEGLRVRVKLLAAAARAIYDRLAEAGTFVVSATRNGGAHGYDGSGARSAMAGAVSGFTKALTRERSAATVKVIDFALDATPDDVAGAIVDETMRDAGVVEIGRRGAVRLAIGLEERAAAAELIRVTRSVPTRSSSPPERPEASCRPSSPIWRDRPAGARSTFST